MQKGLPAGASRTVTISGNEDWGEELVVEASGPGVLLTARDHVAGEVDIKLSREGATRLRDYLDAALSAGRKGAKRPRAPESWYIRDRWGSNLPFGGAGMKVGCSWHSSREAVKPFARRREAVAALREAREAFRSMNMSVDLVLVHARRPGR